MVETMAARALERPCNSERREAPAADLLQSTQTFVLPDGIQIGIYPAEDRCRCAVTPSGNTLVRREMLGQGTWNGSIA